MSNHRFGYIIEPLVKPMYVLQMARTKSWSTEAKIKHLNIFIAGCEESLAKARQLRYFLRSQTVPKPTKNATDQKADDIMASRLEQTGRY